MKNMTILVATAWLLAGTGLCPAGVVNSRFYHLGEADPGASPGLPGDPSTIDSVSGMNASKVGLAYYWQGTNGGGIAPGSTLAMAFTNVDSRYVATADSTLGTQNFGMEAYVLVSLGVTNAIWFYNGGNGLPGVIPSDGYGLGLSGGQYAVFVSGSSFLTGVFASPSQPVEMALVNTGSNSFSVYIQDSLVLTFSAPFTVPSAADVLSLGNFQGNYSPPSYSGIIDEARTFTFTSGGFEAATDLGAPAAAIIPEPPALLLAAIGAALVLSASCIR